MHAHTFLHRILAIAILPLAALACGGLNTTGSHDGGIDDGTTTDTDAATDVPPDWTDTADAPDTASEPDADDPDAEDTVDDTMMDTVEDTVEDTVVDTGVDTVEDTVVDTGMDTGVDTVVDTGVDTGVDTVVDTGVDTVVDTGVDTVVDTGVDTVVDTGVDTATDTAMDPDVHFDIIEVDVIWDIEVITPVCGNSMLEAREKCDDGDLANGDGCNPTCDLWGTVTTEAGDPGSSGSSDGTGSMARFDTPTAVATDGTTVWVSDTANCTIREVDIATWDVGTLAGIAGTCGHHDGSGSTTEFDHAQGLAYESGYLFVADTDNHVIRSVEVATGDTKTVAGSPGASGSVDDAGSDARFAEPRGICSDGTYLWVADFANHTVRRVDLSTFDVVTWAGSPGSSGSADGTGSAARFDSPRGIACWNGWVYVADTANNTIRRVDPTTGAVTTIAGSAGASGSADGTGSAARFDSPRGITADMESLYVTDFANGTIRQILIGSWDVTTLAGTAGASGTTDGTGTGASFDGPWGIAFDPVLGPPQQRLFVTESSGHVLRLVE